MLHKYTIIFLSTFIKFKFKSHHLLTFDDINGIIMLFGKTYYTLNNVESLSDSLNSVEKSADGTGNKLKNMLSDIGISIPAMQAFEMLKDTLKTNAYLC